VKLVAKTDNKRESKEAPLATKMEDGATPVHTVLVTEVQVLQSR